MKILHVINSLSIGGAEKLLTELVPLQMNDGYQVDVIRFAPGETAFVSQLRAAGVTVLTLGHSKKDIYNPLLVLKLMRYIKRYDIIHVHLFPAQYWVAFASLFVHSNVLLVTTEHSTDNRRRKLWGFQWIDKFVYKRYRKIIAISDKTAEALAKYLQDKDRICVINNGVDLIQVQKAEPLNICDLIHIPKSSTIILQVARFSEQKDQDTVIRSLKYLPDSYHVVFAGDGVRRKECEDLTRHENVKNRTHFLGMRNDVPRILKTADIIVMSSHWEGFGLAAVEGMAAGKPVVASNVPGLAEVVKGAGLLFEKGNAAELAAEIKKLTDDPAYYDKARNKCIERARSYDIHIMKDQYDSVYHNILDGNNRRDAFTTVH